MDGILIIDKPQGITSHDVVSLLRRKTGIRKIGHSGTLDPMATGVLPVFIGKATKIIEYANMPDDPEAKIYRCTMRLGFETDTQDIWGSRLEKPSQTAEFQLSLVKHKDEIERVLKSFEGSGVQRPPLYSAVKVGGRRLYEYARKGISLADEKIKERKIYIKYVYVNHINEETNDVVFDVHCSKGVYIRTLCSDAGKALGCGGVMSGLTRLRSDSFSIDDAISVENLKDCDTPFRVLIRADKPLEWMKRADLPENSVIKFTMGQTIALSEKEYLRVRDEQHVRVYNGNSFLGIGKPLETGFIKPEKILV